MCCSVLSHSVMSYSSWPHRLQHTRFLCPLGFSRQEYWSGFLCPPPGDLPNPGIKPLLAEPPRKPKNTGVGSLSLLQGIFLIQESNRGLLHCRQILYQLSYPGSPRYLVEQINVFWTVPRLPGDCHLLWDSIFRKANKWKLESLSWPINEL